MKARHRNCALTVDGGCSYDILGVTPCNDSEPCQGVRVPVTDTASYQGQRIPVRGASGSFANPDILDGVVSDRARTDDDPEPTEVEQVDAALTLADQALALEGDRSQVRAELVEALSALGILPEKPAKRAEQVNTLRKEMKRRKRNRTRRAAR